MSSETFKIIIAGGSVAGLTLANMLEQNNIEYIVLEKYGSIAPQLGASIAVMPNGARILDQLGAWDPLVSSLTEEEIFQHLSMRDADGSELFNGLDFQATIRERVGYGFVFVDRQQLVKTLYDNLRNKCKVLVNKGVIRVEQSTKSIIVHTEDGDSFEGHVLVGADGVHSMVRREMWRLADTEQPGYLSPHDKNDTPTRYKCIFGISRAVAGFDLDKTFMVSGVNSSYLVSVGPEKKIYWFLFQRLPETTYGLYEKLPRYTDEDLHELVSRHLDDSITTTVSFGDLWKNRTAATLTALPEYVMSKWHYGRIMCIGDAVHKFNPIGGQGGNSAIETCAVFANQLHGLIKSPGGDRIPTCEELKQAFETIFALRHDRTVMLRKAGASSQAMFARETWVHAALNRIMLPFSSIEQIFAMQWKNWKGAARLEMKDVVSKPHTTSFDDELPKGEARGINTSAIVLGCLPIMIVAVGVGGTRLEFGKWLSLTSLSELGQRFLGMVQL